jgi:hypothetical protein
VKLVVEKPQSEALARHVDGAGQLATSRVALVEVTRACSLANPAGGCLAGASSNS